MLMNLIFALLSLFLAVLIGMWIGHATRDEHRVGRPYFVLLQRICLILTALVLFWWAFRELAVVAGVGVIVGVVCSRLRVLVSVRYLFFGLALALAATFPDDAFILVGSFLLVYSLAYGTVDIPSSRLVVHLTQVAVCILIGSLIVIMTGDHNNVFFASLCAGILMGMGVQCSR